MAKLKLLFVIPEYSHGGTNKSLENLLFFLNKENYDIHIFSIHEDGGIYYKKIFKDYIIKKSLTYRLAHDNFITRKLANLYRKAVGWSNWKKLYKREVNCLMKKNDFDCVIAFQEGAATYFVSYFPKAIHKIAWIHCDYYDWANGVQRNKDKSVYGLHAKIVCVSETSRKSFCKVFPEYEKKSVSIYNTLDEEAIKRLSEEKTVTTTYSPVFFNIISVGRLSEVKQFDRIPSIVSAMGADVINKIRWYIVGSGLQKETIKKEINRYGLENIVIMLGRKDNPYPYIKNSDLYVCTSSSESFSYTILESKVLHTPVISNNFPVAYEVLDKECGWVCSIEEMPSLLSDIINDKGCIYSSISNSIKKYNYNSIEIINKVDSLLTGEAMN